MRTCSDGVPAGCELASTALRRHLFGPAPWINRLSALSQAFFGGHLLGLAPGAISGFYWAGALVTSSGCLMIFADLVRMRRLFAKVMLQLDGTQCDANRQSTLEGP